MCLEWVGKGKSARAASRILSNIYKDKTVDFLLFTGVAGGIATELKQWDIVIPNQLIQYDMDARPMFERFILPSLNIDRINVNPNILNWANKIVREELNKKEILFFNNLFNGVVGTADKFVSSQSQIEILKKLCRNSA